MTIWKSYLNGFSENVRDDLKILSGLNPDGYPSMRQDAVAKRYSEVELFRKRLLIMFGCRTFDFIPFVTEGGTKAQMREQITSTSFIF